VYRRASLCLALVLAVLLVGPTLAAVPAVEPSGNEWGELVFVELTGRPLAESGASTVASLDAEHAAFRREVTRAGLKVKERYSYRQLFNGLSLEVRPSDLRALAVLPGVKAVWPVVQYPIPELYTSSDMVNALETFEELGYDGTGVLVAIVDTGIDYNHPDLGGGWGNRVIGGWDFVGDDYDARDPARRTPVPDPDPMDPNGHGTHVAGIVGARGRVTGVAPGVGFLALKVFGREGSTTADVIVAALEMALEEGAHVVNMSLGAAFQWPQYPTGQAADRLVRQGVVVVCSQGNNGPGNLFAGGAPALGSKVLAVASFDNTHLMSQAFRLPDGSPVGYMPMAFSPPLPTSGTSPEVVYVGLGNTDADYAGKDVAGKVALIGRGVMSFAHKVTMAMKYGAAYAIIHNNAPGNFRGTLGAAGHWIPAASISREDALRILLLMAAGPVHLTWTDELVQLPNPTAGQISDFSSWGPSPDLALKPDLGAPGGSIYSTYPLALGGYATLSGTSMSAPHVTGAAALLLQAYPNLNPNALGAILRNTSVPQRFSTTAYLLPVHRQGAGMIDVLAAVTAGAKVEPSKVSLGAVTSPVDFTLELENKRETAVTFHVAHLPALASNYNIPSPGLALAYATASFPGTVTVEPGAAVTLPITVAPPAAAGEWLFGGFVRLTPDDGGPALYVPYFGFKGDYLATPALGPGAYGMPWLAELVGDSYWKRDSLTIRPTAGERAYILFHLARHARKVRVEVFEAATGRSFGRVLDLDYVGRNSLTTTFFTFEWDGSGRRGPVAAGTYVLRLLVQRPLGDDDNPEHWDIWTSGPITVIK